MTLPFGCIVSSRVSCHSMVNIGLISDTHSLLRPQALNFLEGCDQILHAGDIGEPEVIEKLSRIAPVSAVRGNIDIGDWASRYPETETIEVVGKSIYLLHNLSDLDIDPVATGFDVVISGHSHKPNIERIGEVLYINPGSAGPRRFKLPITAGKLTISGTDIDSTIVELVD